MANEDPPEEAALLTAEEKMKLFWNELVSFGMDPTEAALLALPLISGVEVDVEKIKKNQTDVMMDLIRRHQQFCWDVVSKDNLPLTDDFWFHLTEFLSNPLSVSHAKFTKPFCCGDWDTSPLNFPNLEIFYAKVHAALESQPDRSSSVIAAITAGCSKSLVDGQPDFVFVLLGLEVHEFGYDFSSLSAICRLVASLSIETKNEIRHLLETTVPMSMVQKYLNSILFMINVSLVTSWDICDNSINKLVELEGPKVRDALYVMSLLFDSNQARQFRSGHRIPGRAMSHGTLTKFRDYPPGGYLPNEDFVVDVFCQMPMLIRRDLEQLPDQISMDEVKSLDFDFGTITRPCSLSMHLKAALLSQDSQMQQRHEGHRSLIQVMRTGLFSFGMPNMYLVLRIRRDRLVDDAMRELMSAGRDERLRKKLRVIFVGEEGVDEGGVTKEFFLLLFQELLNPDYAIFTYFEDTRLMWINGNALEANAQFELIGIAFGLAIYNRVIIDVNLPLALYKKLQGIEPTLLDLAQFMPSLANSLHDILYNFSPEQIDDLSLTWSAIVDRFGTRDEVPISPKVDPTTPVTFDTREEYVEAYLQYVFHISIHPQFESFLLGFKRACNGGLFSLFALTGEELELLICGASSDNLDLTELEEHADYRDGYTKASPTVVDFWDIAHKLSIGDKRRLLAFVTGSDRVPIGGLRSLPLIIGRNGTDTERLPTAHTCFNYLLLPDYQERDKLEKFLSIALENYQGFGLR